MDYDLGSPQNWPMPVVISEGVSPDELIFHGSTNSVRWTPDGGVEELSEYQRAEVERLLPRAGEDPEC